MYTSLLLKVFPVVAILVGLLAKYYLNNLQTRLFAIINNEELSDNAMVMSMLRETTLLDPTASALRLLAQSNSFLDSEPGEWSAVLSTTNTKVESRAVRVDHVLDDETLLPVHRISLLVKSAMNESELFNVLTSTVGQECVFPRLRRTAGASPTRPALMQYDWHEGSIAVDYVTSPFIWPFYDRAYTLFTVKHPATHTFVAQSIQLSVLDEKLLLPTPLMNRGTKKATLSISLRVRKVKQTYNGVSDVSLQIPTHKIEILYFVSGVVERAEVDHYINTAYFIPNLVHSVNSLLAK